MRSVAVMAALLLGLAPTARADGGAFGLGLIVGRPTGITGAYELSDKHVIDGALGLDIFDDRHLYVHVEYLWRLGDLLSGGSVGLTPYLGAGVYVTDRGGNDDRLGLGLRAPFGLSLDFTKAPLQLFLELVLTVPVVPGLDIGVGGAGGFRYYF